MVDPIYEKRLRRRRQRQALWHEVCDTLFPGRAARRFARVLNHARRERVYVVEPFWTAQRLGVTTVMLTTVGAACSALSLLL